MRIDVMFRQGSPLLVEKEVGQTRRLTRETDRNDVRLTAMTLNHAQSYVSKLAGLCPAPDPPLSP